MGHIICIVDEYPLLETEIFLAWINQLSKALLVLLFAFTENETPSIAGNTSINVEVGKPVYMQFIASDDSDKKPLYKILKQPPGFTLNETIGTAEWIPESTNVSEIR